MDFDNIITLVIFIAFFILPSVFKILVSKKEKAAESSFFGKIGEKIQKFVQELEQQSQNQNQGQKESENVWEDMFESQSEPPAESFAKPPPAIPEKNIDDTLPPRVSVEDILKPYEKKQQKTIDKERHLKGSAGFPEITGGTGYRSGNIRQLQNAVIWSEILASPVALRNK